MTNAVIRRGGFDPQCSGIMSPNYVLLPGQQPPGAWPPHTHPISEVQLLQGELDVRPTEAPMDGQIYGRSNGAWVVSTVTTVDWANITGKPATFPPTAHSHLMVDVTDLAPALDAKVDASGDTMIGMLALAADPVAPMDAATKQYVDTMIATVLPLGGLPGQALAINAANAPQWGAAIDGANY